MNNEKMLLSGNSAGFTWNVADEKQFYAREKRYAVLRVSAETEELTFTVNGVEYTYDKNISGDMVLVIDIYSGDIYVNSVKETTSSVLQAPSGKVDSFGIKVNSNQLAVYSVSFFSSLTDANAYTGINTDDGLISQKNRLESATLKSAYNDASTEESALLKAREFAESLVSGYTVYGVKKISYTEASNGFAGKFEFSAIIYSGDIYSSIFESATMSFSISAKPSAPIVLDFDSSFVPKLSGHSSTLKLVGNRLRVTSNTTEDSCGFTMNLPAAHEQFYLQDYPYMKIVLKRTGYSGSSMGIMQYYSGNDVHGTYGTARDFNFCTVADNGKWLATIFDFNKNTVAVSDLDNNAYLRTVGAARINGGYDGLTTHFRFTFARGIKVERVVEIEYIAFFSSLEEAQAFRQDNYYGSYAFNGVEYAEAQNDLTEVPSTLELGIRGYKNSNTAMVLLSNKNVAGEYYYSIETDENGKVKFNYGGNTVLVSTTSIYNNAWTQIAVTFENGSAKLYINGTLENENAEFTVNIAVSKKAPVVAGDSGGGNKFVGYVAYVRAFNRVLTASEIDKISFANGEDISFSPMIYWDLSELDKSREFNDSANGNNLSLLDNYGKTGHEFSGSEYVYSEATLGAYPKTFEWWMKVASVQEEGVYTILSNVTENGGSLKISFDNGCLKFIYGYEIVFTTDVLNVTDSVWAHFAIAIGDNSVKLYINGELYKKYDITVPLDNEISGSIIFIGNESTKNGGFVGYIADVRIWSVERSIKEISDNRFEYVSSTENLILSYRLDEQINYKYKDYSDKENHGKHYAYGWYKLEDIETDYTIIQVSDTQSYMFGTLELMGEMYKWIADNQKKLNIVQVNHLGDVVQMDTPMEWQFASEAHEYIENKIPYVIALGNHDYASPYTGIGAEFRDTSNYEAVFPLDRLKSQLEAAPGSKFGGVFEDWTGLICILI